MPAWPSATARLKAIGRLARRRPSGRRRRSAREPVARSRPERGLVDRDDDVDQVEARERHRQDGVDARAPGPAATGCCGHGQDDRPGSPRPASRSWLDERRGPSIRPCSSAVDDDDVRPQLLRPGRRHRPPSVMTSSSLIWRLRVEEAADVLRDLRHVLDEEEADLDRLLRHIGPDDTTLDPAGRRTPGDSGDHDRPIACRVRAARGRSRRRGARPRGRRPRRIDAARPR